MRRYADADTPPGNAHTRTAHPFLPDLAFDRSVYPNHRSNPPHQTPTGVPRLQGIRERRPRLVRQVPTNDRPAQAPAPKPGVPRRVLSRQRPEEGQGTILFIYLLSYFILVRAIGLTACFIHRWPSRICTLTWSNSRSRRWTSTTLTRATPRSTFSARYSQTPRVYQGWKGCH